MNEILGKPTTAAAFSDTDGRQVHKYSNYFEIYDRYLERYRTRRPKILEIGVQHGGSLLMWNSYFGGQVDIVGMDILPECKKFENGNIRIYIGDQSDRAFLTKVVAEQGPFDVIIDDGSHVPRHQIASFETLFYEGLAVDGVYICEDCHTSYWRNYGGGLRRSGTFVEYAKRLCDQLNAWVSGDAHVQPDRATEWIKSIAFFSSVVVFEKAAMSSPEYVSSGQPAIDLEAPFQKGRYAAIVMPLKKSKTIQGLVRRHPAFWSLMKRMMKS